jgi:hypothetical protein
MRSERRSKTIPALAEHLDDMATIVEHQRSNPRATDGTEGKRERRVLEAVAVVVFEESDGTETIEVVGDVSVGSLELKGVLHDGLYAMAHKGDEGFAPA